MPKKSQLLTVFVTVFIYLVGFGIIIPLLPYLSRQYGATTTDVGLLMSVYSLFQFVFAPMWGSLSDRIGRRPILLFCLVGEAFSYVLFAFATELWVLFAARMLAGFFGASISTASAYISDITPASERSKGMGIIGAAFGLGFIVGPSLGGVLSKWGQYLGTEAPLGLSFPSLWVAILCLLTAFFAYFKLPESLNITAEHRAMKRKSRFRLIKQTFTRPLLGYLVLMFFFSTVATANMEPSLIFLLQDKFLWNVETASFSFAYVGIMMAFTQGFLIRKLLPRFGERKLLVVGLILMGGSLSLIPFADGILFLAVVMTGFALGNGFTTPSIMGSISLASDPSEQGEAMGVAQSMSSLGRILGPAMGGFLYGRFAMEAPFYVAGAMAFVALVLVIITYRRLPNAGQTKGAAQGRESHQLGEIGSFQLQNLVQNKVPFRLCLLGVLKPSGAPKNDLFKDLWARTTEVQKPEEFLQALKQDQDLLADKNTPLIVAANNPKQARGLAQKLEAEGFLNPFFLNIPWSEALPELQEQIR